MSKIFVRSAYNYNVDEVSQETGLRCEDESLAQQHQKDEADINTIVRRFGLSGELPSNVRMPQYGDFTGVSDYQSALEAVRAADAAFMTMPADVRSRFENDAAQFVEFCLDDRNREEAEKLGLVVPKAVSEPKAKESAPSVAGGGTPPAAV